MTDRQQPVHVRMGELALGTAPDLLKATLGSCVGIAFVWRSRNLFALAHCLLPHAPGPGMPPGARYVDQAVQSLLLRLQAGPADYAQIEAHLAGGASMREGGTAGQRTPVVGALNVEAALQLLQARGIAVHSQDTGGTCARQIRVDCAEASVSVARVSAP